MLELEVVTPRRRLFKVSCDTVTLPGSLGECQVLSGHAALMTGIKTGILTFTKSALIESSAEDPAISSDSFSMMVSGGFAEVADDKVSVLSEFATLPSEVNEKNERQTIDSLQQKIQELKDIESKEFSRLEAELERSAVRLTLLKS